MIRAKFSCESVTKFGYGSEQVKLRAVGPKTGEILNAENASFSKATPSGTLEMTIDNPEAQGFFKPGGEYYLDFSAPEQAKEAEAGA